MEEKDFNINQKYCPNCYTLLGDFLSSGYIGCEKCYETFTSEIENYIKVNQYSNNHTGKIYLKNSNKSVEQKINELQKELKRAVEEQRFEDCAVLKHKIDDIKEKL